MKRLYTTLLVTGLLVSAPLATGAETLYNPLGSRTIPQLIGFLIQAALGLSGSIALAMIVYGGFLWLTAGGESGKIEKGKNTLLWSILGLAVIFAANVLATFVINTLGAATAA